MTTPTTPAYPEAPAPQQPKKKHTFRNIMLVVLALFIAAFAGCAALIGGAVEEADKAIKAEAANNKPSEVTEGEAFEHDIWSVKPGWKIKPGPLGATVVGLRAELTGDTADAPLLTFTLDKGKQVMASIDCTGPQAQPGQVVRIGDCIPDGKAKGYDTVTVRDLL